MKKFILLSTAILFSWQGFAQSTLAGEEEELGTRYNQYGVKVNRTRLSAEERNGIIVFESKDQNYRLWFDNRVQVDGAMHFGLDKDFQNIGNNVSIRRARFAIKAQVNEHWYGEIDTDFSNGYFELKDAYLRYSTCFGLDIKAGNFKENFSMEETTSSRYLPFMERPMAVKAFAPSRHIGLDINYANAIFNISGGMAFQAVAGEEEILFVEANNKDNNLNQGVDWVGKLVLHPFSNHQKDWGMHLGGGIVYRTPKTDVAYADYGTSRFSTRNNSSINRKKYLDTDVIGNVHHELLYNGEMAWWYKGLRVQGEYLATDVHIKHSAPIGTDLSTKHFYGFYAHAGILLFGGKQRYDASDGEFTQPSRGKKWGDIELLARYDYLNLNDKSANIYGGAGENYTLGLTYYINNNVKFMLNGMYTNNDRYANGKGKLYVGHDSAGKPTANPALVTEKKGKAGVDYYTVGVRFEIDF